MTFHKGYKEYTHVSSLSVFLLLPHYLSASFSVRVYFGAFDKCVIPSIYSVISRRPNGKPMEEVASFERGRFTISAYHPRPPPSSWKRTIDTLTSKDPCRSFHPSGLISLFLSLLSLCLSLPLPPSLYFPLGLSASLHPYLTLYLPLSLSLCLSLSLSQSISVSLSVSLCLSLPLSFSIPLSLSVSLSICLSISSPSPLSICQTLTHTCRQTDRHTSADKETNTHAYRSIIS